jgi:serine protease AprX
MAIASNRSVWKIIIFILGLIFFRVTDIHSQTINYNYFYRVSFIDKGNYTPPDFNPSDLLSQKAIDRRKKAGIAVPDFKDIPVDKEYINNVVSFGFTLHCTSHWLNTGLFKTENAADVNLLLNLPFVKEVKLVRRPAVKGISKDKLQVITEQGGIPPYDNPVTLLDGQVLHSAGYDGKGILIAILDGGFYQADIISSLGQLRARKGIKATYDFVLGTSFVYSFHNHGTAVLSVLAGLTQDEIEGSAPGADFCLIRTEDTSSEFPVEEDYWAAGAEYADSIGADIISSSLGYFVFDDPSMDYKFTDMNGRTTFVTRAAEAAASKGILVVTSAGNERSTAWQRIIAPTDGDSVLSSGAIDGYNIISSFSSAGPSADGRIKPDNVAQGVSVPVQIQGTSFARANGTSFSCPLLSGICACAMQAVPEALNMDIVKTLHKNGDKAAKPDSLYGYGLPDMVKVVESLENKFVNIPENAATIGPNPFTENLEIVFREPPGSIEMEVYNISGSTIVRRSYPDYISRTLDINDLANKSQGLYFIKLRTADKTIIFKVTKINK